MRLLELTGLQRGADFDVARWGALDGVTLFRCEKEKEVKPPPIVIALEEEEEEAAAAAAAGAPVEEEGEAAATTTTKSPLTAAEGAEAATAPPTSTSLPLPSKLVRLPRYLCLVHERLLVLAAHPTLLGRASVKSNHHVSELAKLSYSKRRPGRLSLFYRRTRSTGGGAGGAEDVTVQRVYYVDLADEFMAALGAAISRVQ